MTAPGKTAFVVALFCAGLAALDPASATAGFGPPADLSAAGQGADLPRIALDGAGNAIAVWQRYDGSNFRVQASYRPAGAAASFGPPQDLSAAGGDALNPQIALDDAGNALAVWQRYDGTRRIVQAAYRMPGDASSFGTPADLSVADHDAYEPEVAFDTSGNALAIWRRSNGTNLVVQVAYRAAGGASHFGAPASLSAADQDAALFGGAHLAFDCEGRAFAIWGVFDGTQLVIQASVRPPGASSRFSTPANVSLTGRDAFGPQLALDTAGNAWAVWQRFDGNHFIAQVAHRRAGTRANFGTPADLSAPGQDAFNPQIASDRPGRATAIWQRSDGTHQIVQAAAHSGGPPTRFGAPVNLSAAGRESTAAQIAFAPDGRAFALWRSADGAGVVVQAAQRPTGGSFGAPANLSAPGLAAYSPQIAIDARGNAFAAWEQSEGADLIIQVSHADPAVDAASNRGPAQARRAACPTS